MALTFRKALPSDDGDAERVLRSAFTPYVRKLGRELTADYYAWVGAAIERGDVFVALEGDQMVGVAVTERRADGLYIDRLAVDPARQSAGLGSWLLARLEEVARSSGLSDLSLETAEMTDHIVRLYRRHGFEIVGRGLPSHGKDSYTRVHMAKALRTPKRGVKQKIGGSGCEMVKVAATSMPSASDVPTRGKLRKAPELL